MADSSFDIVSKLDRQEVDNAVNQAAKEVSTRYDFRGVDASIRLSGDAIEMEANTPERVMAIVDVLQTKLIRRGVSLKALDLKDREPKASGKIYRLVAPLREGIEQDVAKKITKLIRDEGPKGVKAQIRVMKFASLQSLVMISKQSSHCSRAPREKNLRSHFSS